MLGRWATGDELTVGGVYRTLLEYEREFGGPSSELLALLEAGKPVVLGRARVEAVLMQSISVVAGLGFGPSVRFVQVARDDSVTPAAHLDRAGAVAEGQ